MADPDDPENMTEDDPAPAVAPEIPTEAPAATPPAREATMLEANYHIALWAGPTPTYLCLLCAAVDMDHASVLYHVTSAHGVEAIPSPIAADYLASNPVLTSMVQPEEIESGGEPDREPGDDASGGDEPQRESGDATG